MLNTDVPTALTCRILSITSQLCYCPCVKDLGASNKCWNHSFYPCGIQEYVGQVFFNKTHKSKLK